MTILANAERLAWEAIAAALNPPPPVDYLKWAEENIVFTKRESPEPGPYNRDRFSYFNVILRALSPDDPCRVVTFMKSAQLGGTVLANVFEFTEGCAPHYGNATYPGHPGESAEYEVLSVAVHEKNSLEPQLPCPDWLSDMLESLVTQEAMAEQVEFDLQPAEDD